MVINCVPSSASNSINASFLSRYIYKNIPDVVLVEKIVLSFFILLLLANGDDEYDDCTCKKKREKKKRRV